MVVVALVAEDLVGEGEVAGDIIWISTVLIDGINLIVTKPAVIFSLIKYPAGY